MRRMGSKLTYANMISTLCHMPEICAYKIWDSGSGFGDVKRLAFDRWSQCQTIHLAMPFDA